MIEICGLHFGLYFFFEYFLRIPFVRERSPKRSGDFGGYRHEWVKPEEIFEGPKIIHIQFSQIITSKKQFNPYAAGGLFDQYKIM